MKPNNSLSMISAALLSLVAGATMLLAQWPAYKTQGPRTPTGELDLTAPAPKAADGHPDRDRDADPFPVPHHVVGGDFVESYGGRVELIPLVPGRSSSDTLARLAGKS